MNLGDNYNADQAMLDRLTSTPYQVEAALDEMRVQDALFLAMEDAIDSAVLAVYQIVQDCGLGVVVAQAIADEVRRQALDYVGNHYGD